LFLGGPRPEDPPPCQAARDAFDAGDLNRALQRWPRRCRDQRRALAAYKKKHEPAAAVAAIDKRMKRLYVSALQSRVFNDILARRLETIDTLMTGDVAQKVPGGGMFIVEDAPAEQPRCESFEISPTGLLPGSRPLRAQGVPARIEREAMAEAGVSEEMFDKVGSLRMKGARRALRFRLEQVDLQAGDDEHGPFLSVDFSCPPGSYATVVLAEIMKTDPPPT
jgi:tRNA pseudouridine13 synthase